MQEERSSDSSNIQRLAFQAFFAIFTGLFLFVFLWLASIIVDQIWNANKIMPGISMQGIDLSGLSKEEAANKLKDNISFTNTGEITLMYADLIWQATPYQLGLDLNIEESVRQAYEFGRKGSLGRFLAYQLLSRRSSHDLPPVMTFDQQKAYDYLYQVSQAYDLPLREASLELNGTQVQAIPGQAGRRLDIPASIDRMTDQVRLGDFTSFNLVLVQQQPEIKDASQFAAAAQEFLAQPFSLRIPEGQPEAGRKFTIKPEDMAPMLVFTRQQQNNQAVLVPEFRPELLNSYLNDLATRVNIWPQNARFIFNDETRQLDLLSSSALGRVLDIQASLTAIQSALTQRQSSSTLTFNTVAPAVDDSKTATDLGITELVHMESSYFFGSSEARIQNIEKASSEFHGLLIPPGATFSMAANMGDVSLDNGYTEALIIYNGRTIEGVGGGVCQVSTTLFRTAFFVGFPITERYPHAYRVSYYEKTSGNGRDSDLAGLDATVYVPLVDLKFTNDTSYWLLMETYVNRAFHRLTWKFYSTSDGRSVEWLTTGPVNIVEPKKPLYKLNEKLNAGEIKQVDWEADGADVRVERSVYRDGILYFSDTFYTHYEPWRAIYEYGPGTDGIPTSDETQ
ncbi:MAG: VanW family protein [Anaerolineaceae bacterium]|nr:VanW family protein [Anaerolineaceae bacterium]